VDSCPHWVFPMAGGFLHVEPATFFSFHFYLIDEAEGISSHVFPHSSFYKAKSIFTWKTFPFFSLPWTNFCEIRRITEVTGVKTFLQHTKVVTEYFQNIFGWMGCYQIWSAFIQGYYFCAAKHLYNLFWGDRGVKIHNMVISKPKKLSNFYLQFKVQCLSWNPRISLLHCKTGLTSRKTLPFRITNVFYWKFKFKVKSYFKVQNFVVGIIKHSFSDHIIQKVLLFSSLALLSVPIFQSHLMEFSIVTFLR